MKVGSTQTSRFVRHDREGATAIYMKVGSDMIVRTKGFSWLYIPSMKGFKTEPWIVGFWANHKCNSRSPSIRHHI